jgi:glycosyltransferase involved in cell wall biosynthesis
MNDHPAVTILIPAYRHERFIGEAIRSALAQDFQDFELIVIDDASPDATAERVRAFDDPRLRFTEHAENQGSCSTINEGLRSARGRYVAILNSDDRFHPQRLGRLYALAEESGASLVCSDLELIDADSAIVRDKSHWWLSWYEDLKAALASSNDPVAALLRGNFVITTSNFFVRRTVFGQIGYLNEYRYTLDYEFLLRLLAQEPDGLRFVDEKLLDYRLHGDNTIREDALAPNWETLQLLTAWFPEFLEEPARSRCLAQGAQIRKVAGHIETEIRLVCERRVREALAARDEALAARDAARQQQHDSEVDLYARLASLDQSWRELNELNHRKDAELARVSHEMALAAERHKTVIAEFEGDIRAIRACASYRLGSALLAPLRLFRNPK